MPLPSPRRMDGLLAGLLHQAKACPRTSHLSPTALPWLRHSRHFNMRNYNVYPENPRADTENPEGCDPTLRVTFSLTRAQRNSRNRMRDGRAGESSRSPPPQHPDATIIPEFHDANSTALSLFAVKSQRGSRRHDVSPLSENSPGVIEELIRTLSAF